MNEESDELRLRITTLETQLKVHKAQTDAAIERLTTMLTESLNTDDRGGQAASQASHCLAWFKNVLGTMTLKQHATLQMLMAHQGNSKISEVIGVKDNASKMYVRALMQKLELRKRAEIAMLANRLMKDIPEDEYSRLSNGLPKNWWRDRQEPDEFYSMYGSRQ
jgi:DNA-binding CsgD family transcriptional regulator